MLVTNIQIILKNSSPVFTTKNEEILNGKLQFLCSVFSTLFHLIDLDLRCWISKLIRALGHLRHTLTNSLPKGKVFILYGLIFTGLDYGFVWFDFYLDFVVQSTIKKPASSSVTAKISTQFKATHTPVQAYTPLPGKLTCEFTATTFSNRKSGVFHLEASETKLFPKMETSYDYAVLHLSPVNKYKICSKSTRISRRHVQDNVFSIMPC